MPTIESSSQQDSFILKENDTILKMASERLSQLDWLNLCDKYKYVREDLIKFLPGLKVHPSWNYLYDYFYTCNSHGLEIPQQISILHIKYRKI